MKAYFFLASFFALTVAPLCVSADDVFRVGAIIPMSGPAAFLGDLESGGIKIAADKFNRARAPGVPKIEYVFEDSQSDPKAAVSAFNKLAADGIQLILVSLTSANMAIRPLAERRGVVVISDSSHPHLTKDTQFLFRNMYSTDAAALEILSYMKERSLKRLGVLHTEDEFGVVGADQIGKLAASYGVEVVSRHDFKTTDHDVRAQVLELVRDRPDMTFILGVGPVQAIALKQARQQNLAGAIAGYLFCSQGNLLAAAGDAAEGVLSLEPASDWNAPAWKEFQKEFELRFPGTYFESLAGLGYEFIQIAEASARHGKRSGDEIREFLQTSKIDGLLSTIEFDEDSNIRAKPMVPRTITSGRCQPLAATESSAVN